MKKAIRDALESIEKCSFGYSFPSLEKVIHILESARALSNKDKLRIVAAHTTALTKHKDDIEAYKIDLVRETVLIYRAAHSVVLPNH